MLLMPVCLSGAMNDNINIQLCSICSGDVDEASAVVSLLFMAVVHDLRASLETPNQMSVVADLFLLISRFNFRYYSFALVETHLRFTLST